MGMGRESRGGPRRGQARRCVGAQSWFAGQHYVYAPEFGTDLCFSNRLSSPRLGIFLLCLFLKLI